MRARGGVQGIPILLLVLACVAGQGGDEDQCFQMLHPPKNYVLAIPEEQNAVEVQLRLNCEEEAGPRGDRLQVFSATGNGTAGGSPIWEQWLDGEAELLEVSWILDQSEHWHCSGWRQWLWVLTRSDGSRETAMMRIRAAILDQALEDVAAAPRRAVPPFVLQIGAMDGVGHDHLHPFIKTGAWRGLFVEPLPDYFEELRTNLEALAPEGALAFANKCIAEADGRRWMRRLAPAALKAQHGCLPRGRLRGALTCAAQGEGAELLGLDGSSSLLADEAGLPPGIARSVERGGGAALRASVAAHMVSEAVDCVTLARLLDEHGVQEVDVFAVDTEGYDLEIVKQLLGTRLRPAVVFIEVGLLSPADQRAAERALGAEGYATRRCGYGMELLARRDARGREEL